MTDSQRLLAEYVQTGSDTAFRELITRYVGLVYSTACRLVDGDTHRAEDAAQIVFVDLARTARTLPGDCQLGSLLIEQDDGSNETPKMKIQRIGNEWKMAGPYETPGPKAP